MLTIIPFRGEEWWRVAAKEYVADWYSELNPVFFDAGGRLFNKSKTINQAISQSDANIIIMIDVDTIVEMWRVWGAVDKAEDGAGLVLPFDRLAYMSPTSTQQIFDGADPFKGVKPEWVATPSSTVALVGGVNVFTRQTWVDAGGFPEEVEGWGAEDVVWARRCSAVAPTVRLNGDAIHLYHPKNGEYYSNETIEKNRQVVKGIG